MEDVLYPKLYPVPCLHIPPSPSHSPCPLPHPTQHTHTHCDLDFKIIVLLFFFYLIDKRKFRRASCLAIGLVLFTFKQTTFLKQCRHNQTPQKTDQDLHCESLSTKHRKRLIKNSLGTPNFTMGLIEFQPCVSLKPKCKKLQKSAFCFSI